MSAAEAIFQKDLYKITREDLESFFAEPQEENAILEFKEGNTDLVKLHDEVAAFLNTEGGLLIYGAPREIEHPSKKGYKIAQGALTAAKVRDRDVIMRSLGTGISPAPTTVRIAEIEIDGGSVYLLEVGQSSHPPHQVTGSGKYHIRLEREAKHAPHGIVEALFFRRQKPQLQIQTVCVKKNYDEGIDIKIDISNTSVITAESIGYIITLFGAARIDEKQGCPSFRRGAEAVCQHFSANDILVRGISRHLAFNIKPSVEFILISVYVYCKDTDVVGENLLVSVKKGLVDSRDYVDENETNRAILYSMYHENNRNVFLGIFSDYTELGTEDRADADVIYELSDTLGCEVPQCYLHFLLLFNGIGGTIGTSKIALFSFADLFQFNANTDFSTSGYFIIGVMDAEYSIVFATDESKNKFGILWQIGTVGFVGYNETLYGLLCMIRDGKVKFERPEPPLPASFYEPFRRRRL